MADRVAKAGLAVAVITAGIGVLAIPRVANLVGLGESPKPIPTVAAGGASPSQSSHTLIQFATEREAQVHCPSDTVVWLNLPTGIYHLQGQINYGKTKSGAYVCKTEADQAGDSQSHNGQ